MPMRLNPRHTIIRLALVIAAVLTALLVLELKREHALAVKASGARTRDEVGLLEEHARQSLQRVERAQGAVAATLEPLLAAPVGDAAVLRRALQAQVPADGSIRGWALIGADAAVLAASSDETADVATQFARRDAFAAWRDTGRAAPLVGAPLALSPGSPSPRWLLPVARRVGAPDGAFRGVVLANVDLQPFQRFYDAYAVGANGFATLFLREGWIVVRTPANPELMLRNWSDSPMFRSHLPRADADTVRQIVAADQVERIYSYRALNDLPVVVTFGISLTDALMPWRERLVRDTATLAIGLLLLAGATWSLVRQIGQREAAQFALGQSEARYRSLTELSSDWYWKLDAQLRFVEMDGQVQQKTGIESKAHLGKAPWELPALNLNAADWERQRDVLQSHREFRDFEIRRPDLNGARVWVSISGRPIFDAQGRFEGYRGVGRDISRRKQAEADHAALEDQLRESQKMESIGTLAGGIAHDFNNILGSMLGNLALARDEIGPSHPAQASLRQIAKSARRARGLVQQILAFSRRQPQLLVVQPLRALIEEALTLLRPTLPAMVALRVSLSDEPLAVAADATQLQQVLMNLCTNAWHALRGNAGTIRIGLERFVLAEAAPPPHEAMEPGAYAHLWVTDDGVGMDLATRQRVFEPFFTTKPVGVGTGLGLSVVHGIVSAHHGAITVDSEPGVGSTFHVYLPVKDEPLPNSGFEASAVLGLQGEGEHVLYVDDDEVMMLMVVRLLERAGFRVTPCADARTALARVQSGPQDLDIVVSDYNMPGASGLDLARELARVRPGLPVVISSGYLSDELRAQLRQAGVRRVLDKQNTLEELAPLIRAVLAEA